MAQNITLMGASYSDVPAVTLPKTGGGTARFDDASITTATASDVASGKLFLAADGTITTGTSSGGGGSSWVLLGSTEITTSSTSTSNSNVGSISGISGLWDGDAVIWVRVRDKAGKRDGYFYGSDAIFFNYMSANGSTGTLTACPKVVSRVDASGNYACNISTNGYGVYCYSITSGGKVTIYRRYNSSYSLTINGTYAVEVYKLTLANGEKVFD